MSQAATEQVIFFFDDVTEFFQINTVLIELLGKLGLIILRSALIQSRIFASASVGPFIF